MLFIVIILFVNHSSAKFSFLCPVFFHCFPCTGDVPTLSPNFCGRDEIVRSIVKQVVDSSSNPVITLVGPPGFGKTSIAVAVGQRLLQEKTAKVVFVPLRGAQSTKQVTDRIVSTLTSRSPEASTDIKPLRELVKALPGNTLIILDNAEDAICPELQESRPKDTGFDSVVNDIIGSNKLVKVLVTSRVKFQPLDFLVCENLVGGLDEKSAKGLLLRLSPVSNMHHAEQIVRSCVFVPLAICIAAGIMKFEGMSSKELIRLFRQNGLKAIEPGGSWLNPERHLIKMIRAAVTRLPPALQYAFCGLSLFTSPFTAAAGASVLGAPNPLEFKRQFTTELYQRCLLEYDAISNRFSMQPLLSQFGREFCSEQNKKIFHPRFSFHYLNLLQQHVLKLTIHNNSIFFVQFIQFEYPHLCTALQFARALDTEQVKVLRELSIYAAVPLHDIFGPDSVAFFKRCTSVAKKENDREWLYPSFLGELREAWCANQQSARDLTQTMLNLLEQERASTEEEQEMLNTFRLSAISAPLWFECSLEDKQKVAREIDQCASWSLSSVETSASISCLVVRFFLAFLLRQIKGRPVENELCRLLLRIFSELEKCLNRAQPSDDLQLQVFYVITRLACRFVAATLPAPLGMHDWHMHTNSPFLEVCEVLRRLCGMLEGIVLDTQFNSDLRLGHHSGAVMQFRVASSLMRKPHKNIIFAFQLEVLTESSLIFFNHLARLCHLRDSSGVTASLTKLATSSIAEKAFLYHRHKASTTIFFLFKVARDSCDVTHSLTQASIHTSHVHGSKSCTKYSLHLVQSTSTRAHTVIMLYAVKCSLYVVGQF